MHRDVIIIGGSYAGMAAALQLVRARRSVQVIDAGERRNRYASHTHGFLGQDGVSPSEIAVNARRQLETYPTLSWLDRRAEAVSGQVDVFTVTTADGKSHQGRRIGIIGTGPMSIHQAELLTDWGNVTLLVNGVVDLSRDVRSTLERRGVTIEEARIDRIEGLADIALADGRLLRFEGLFTATRTVPSNALAEAMGCALEETPMGVQVYIDAENKTSVPGVFAGGDVARAPHSVSLAVGNGSMAGAQVHRSPLWPEVIHPVQKGGDAL